MCGKEKPLFPKILLHVYKYFSLFDLRLELKCLVVCQCDQGYSIIAQDFNLSRLYICRFFPSHAKLRDFMVGFTNIPCQVNYVL